MESKIIEKLDRQRYRAVVMETVGLLFIFADTLLIYIKEGLKPEMFTFAFGGGFGALVYQFKPLLPEVVYPMEPTARNIVMGASFLLIACIPVILLAIGGIKYGRVWLKTKLSPELHDALYNEMYRQYKYRYQRLALWVTIGVAMLSICIVAPRYPHVIVTQMVVLTGLLTLKISWLIYNKR